MRRQRHPVLSDAGPVLDETHIPTVVCATAPLAETPAAIATVEEPGQPSFGIEPRGGLARAPDRPLPHG